MTSTTKTPATNTTAWIGLILGLLLLLICVFTDPPGGMSKAAWSATGLTLLMAVWWATEAIPIPATSLLPILLIPVLGIGTVFPPFRSVLKSRGYAAMANFWIGVMPPSAMLGRS